MHYSDKNNNNHHHHHQHPGLDPWIRSVSRVAAVLANVSWVFQLIFFLVVCSCTILQGFGFVAFFVCVKASDNLLVYSTAPTCFDVCTSSSGTLLLCVLLSYIKITYSYVIYAKSLYIQWL
jgi:hypothetical protein